MASKAKANDFRNIVFNPNTCRVLKIDAQRTVLTLGHDKCTILIDYQLVPAVQYLIGEVYEFLGEIEEQYGEICCKAVLGKPHSYLDIYLIEKATGIINEKLRLLAGK